MPALCTCEHRDLPPHLHLSFCAVKREELRAQRESPETRRELVLNALVELHRRADWGGLTEAESLVEALGWSHPSEMPDYDWVRARLDETLR